MMCHLFYSVFLCSLRCFLQNEKIPIMTWVMTFQSFKYYWYLMTGVIYKQTKNDIVKNASLPTVFKISNWNFTKLFFGKFCRNAHSPKFKFVKNLPFLGQKKSKISFFKYRLYLNGNKKTSIFTKIKIRTMSVSAK